MPRVAPRLWSLPATLIALCVLLGSGATLARTGRHDPLRTIVLDPGHGGANEGALAVTGIYEKVLTLEVALRVERLLREHDDLEIYLTRRDDRFVGLRERTRFANQVGADVLVSIHFNSEPGHGARGVETYFLSAEASDEDAARVVAMENLSSPGEDDGDEAEVDALLKDMRMHAAHEDSQLLAELTYRALRRRTRCRGRGVKQAPFTVLRGAEMAAVVVEAGFLSHPRESYAILHEDRQEQIARALADAILEFGRRR